MIDPAFTVEELRRLIAQNALTGAKGRPNGLQMPHDAGLAELTSILNHWAGIYAKAKAEHAEAQAIRTAEGAAEALRVALPAVAAIVERLPANPFKAAQAGAIADMQRALAGFALPAATTYRAPGLADQENPDWRWVVSVLRQDFSRHLALFGARDDGPAARLLAAIAKHLTGKAISSARVADFLRKSNKLIT